MDQQAFLHDLDDREPRAERGEGVLEDDLHPVAQGPERFRGDAVDPLAVEHDLALAADQPQQRQAQRGLARAGLSHHPEGLALRDRDAYPVDRLHVADGAAEQPARDREMDLQVPGRDHRPGVGPRRHGRALGLGVEQLVRVGVLGPLEDVLHLALLDDAALGHDADPVGHLADDAEVVGDPQHGHAEARLQVLQQLQHLGLDGDVERGGGLVRDEQLRLIGERHGDHHPLALAA